MSDVELTVFPAVFTANAGAAVGMLMLQTLGIGSYTVFGSVMTTCSIAPALMTGPSGETVHDVKVRTYIVCARLACCCMLLLPGHPAKGRCTCFGLSGVCVVNKRPHIILTSVTQPSAWLRTGHRHPRAAEQRTAGAV